MNGFKFFLQCALGAIGLYGMALALAILLAQGNAPGRELASANSQIFLFFSQKNVDKNIPI